MEAGSTFRESPRTLREARTKDQEQKCVRTPGYASEFYVNASWPKRDIAWSPPQTASPPKARAFVFLSCELFKFEKERVLRPGPKGQSEKSCDSQHNWSVFWCFFLASRTFHQSAGISRSFQALKCPMTFLCWRTSFAKLCSKPKVLPVSSHVTGSRLCDMKGNDIRRAHFTVSFRVCLMLFYSVCVNIVRENGSETF